MKVVMSSSFIHVYREAMSPFCLSSLSATVLGINIVSHGHFISHKYILGSISFILRMHITTSDYDSRFVWSKISYLFLFIGFDYFIPFGTESRWNEYLTYINKHVGCVQMLSSRSSVLLRSADVFSFDHKRKTNRLYVVHIRIQFIAAVLIRSYYFRLDRTLWGKTQECYIFINTFNFSSTVCCWASMFTIAILTSEFLAINISLSSLIRQMTKLRQKQSYLFMLWCTIFISDCILDCSRFCDRSFWSSDGHLWVLMAR